MARAKDNYRGLSGSEKAAIFMLSLPQSHSAKLFGMMDDEEIKELSMTMANLGMIDATIVERLFVEFADQLSSTGSLVGSFDTTERLLLQSMDQEKVNLIMEEIHAPGGGVPLRMAPLVLVTTVITHLFGGSAGREVQRCRWAAAWRPYLANGSG